MSKNSLRRLVFACVGIIGLPVLGPLTGPLYAAEFRSSTVNRDYPDNVYWGDTHVHTYLSGDAFGMGTRVTPDEAYRFAKGEQIRATGGGQAQLRRPLDFLLIADHAESLGVLPRLVAGDPKLVSTEGGSQWLPRLQSAPLADVLSATSLEGYREASRNLMMNKSAWNAVGDVEGAFKLDVWQDVIEVAEKHNDPGRFTAFIGYEYSSNPPMLHRNVLFAGGAGEAERTLPFSKFDSADPEDLWRFLRGYKNRVGGDVISIPHNSNLSGGNMFSSKRYRGEPMTHAYAALRADLEPIIEVTQIKGDSETHPSVSPDDEFADHETWGSKAIAVPKAGSKPPLNKGAKPTAKPASSASKGAGESSWALHSYARPALKLGLQHEANLGLNPFKFGMIGSTDSHNGLATAAEDNFWGKMGENEPGRFRAFTGSIFASAGYAAVWAHENTRESIFAAIKRREVYATTGPRIGLRFFAGWDFSSDDADRPDLAARGYGGGVPMGGDLIGRGDGRTPTFLIHAHKDPDGANLERTQVIKGWRDGAGNLHEKIYDVAWSDDREIGRDGKLEPVGSTVDLADASYRNSIGDSEHVVTWVDRDFDQSEAAFYYVRVIQIPTPRWTAYDAALYGTMGSLGKTPLVIQERAYSSPIWYTP